VSTLEQRLEAEEQRLAKLPRPSTLDGPLDHGMLNLPLSKRGGTIESDIRKWRAVSEVEQEIESLRNRIAYAKRAAPVPFTTEELKAARAIRTSSGWHRVAKVNAKSVSVETGYSWTDRYTLDKILEVRA
jgi:hypothetical protein